MIHEIFMPALSSTMAEGKIVAWAKAPGDKVVKGETVVVVESDKADMDVESFYEGYLATILVQSGETAVVGAPIAYLAETEAEIETAKQQAQSAAEPATAPPAAVTPSPSTGLSPAPLSNGATATEAAPARDGRIVVSPRARKLAKELGIDVGTLKGSGLHGRIVAADVETAAGRVTSPAIAAPAVAPAIPLTPKLQPMQPVSVPSGAPVPLTTLQSAVARNMLASLEVPVIHIGYTITTDKLDQLYQQIKSKGVTMTALLAKAAALTLPKHPLVNASYTPEGIQYKSVINIAVAVAMDDGGLITPVLQAADQIDIYSLSRLWKDLVERARAKKLQPEEYSSGTFTVTNLGMFGVDRFDAILPPGQGSILAIGAARPQVVATSDGLFGVRNQMQVNITCDHRIIYGAHAAAFLKDLSILIETNPQALTL
jgi:pyruvate dehydrogenase E2 component (dihydrolipoamide acetyltransferase)